MYVTAYHDPSLPVGAPDNHAYVSLDVHDRFIISILVKEPCWAVMKDDTSQPAYEGVGTLSIQDNQSVIFESESGVTSHSPSLDDAHMACFGTQGSVPATPLNLMKALEWCHTNPNFMKDREGA